MKTSPAYKLVITLTGVLAIVVNTAFATIVFDLQASGVDASLGILVDSKSVNVTGASGNIYLEVWAQVTGAFPGNNIFGVQAIMGSIVSTTTGPGTAAGTMSVAGAAGPFGAAPGAQAGTVTELSFPGDTVTDLGSNATTPNGDFIRFWKDNGAGGQNVNGVFFATNSVPAGATFNAIPNGYEFKMGVATLSLNNFTANYVSMNWVIPSFSTVAQNWQIAEWTSGDGVEHRGGGSFDNSVGSPVVITAPESSSSAMLAIGVLAAFGCYRGRRGIAVRGAVCNVAGIFQSSSFR